MYTLSGKLKITAIILMIVGAIGLIYGFLSAPSSIEDVKEIIASHEAHGEGHAEAEQATHHVEETHADESHAPAKEAHGEAAHGDEDAHAEHLSKKTYLE